MIINKVTNKNQMEVCKSCEIKFSNYVNTRMMRCKKLWENYSNSRYFREIFNWIGF